MRPFRLLQRSAAAWLCLCAVAACGVQRPARPSRPPIDSAPSAEQLLEIAAVLQARGDRMRAGQYLTLALEHGAPETRVLPRLLALYVRDGQYRLAIDVAENFLRRRPGDLRMRFFLGALYEGVGMSVRAAEQYARVLAVDPARADAHFALASVLREQGTELARADTHYRAYLRLAPSGPYAEEARAALLTELP